MRIFKITKEIEVVCNSEKTRYGFRHLATLFKKEEEIAKSKACYYNRTWERFEFQSVLYSVVKKANLSEEEEKACKEFIQGDQTDWSGFKTTSMIASLGEVFANTKKEKNDWKARMLKAGLPGLNIPEDWDSLDEDTKEKRLNEVIKVMQEVPN